MSAWSCSGGCSTISGLPSAAFDAGYAAAHGKPLITLHPPEHDHALKEVDRAALAVAREPEQVVEILRYALAR